MSRETFAGTGSNGKMRRLRALGDNNEPRGSTKRAMRALTFRGASSGGPPDPDGETAAVPIGFGGDIDVDVLVKANQKRE